MPSLPIIPTWLRALVVVAAIGWLEYELVDYIQTVERQACKLKTTTIDLTQTKADLGASELNRASEADTNKARSEAANDHFDQTSVYRAERDAARDAVERLRKLAASAADLAASCAKGDPAAEQSRQAAKALAEVSAACFAEYRAVAEEADAVHAAGLLAEREYDALTPGRAASEASD